VGGLVFGVGPQPPNPKSPIPNPQSPIPRLFIYIFLYIIIYSENNLIIIKNVFKI